MEIIEKRKVIREVEETIDCYELCDKCNIRIDTELFEVFECELKIRDGESFPEGGDGNLKSMELCQKCSIELVKLLRENGYRVNESKWSH